MVIGCLGMKSGAKAKEKIVRNGQAAFGCRTVLSTVSLALALYFIPRQLITTDYGCQTTHGDPEKKKQIWDFYLTGKIARLHCQDLRALQRPYRPSKRASFKNFPLLIAPYSPL